MSTACDPCVAFLAHPYNAEYSRANAAIRLGFVVIIPPHRRRLS